MALVTCLSVLSRVTGPPLEHLGSAQTTQIESKQWFPRKKRGPFHEQGEDMVLERGWCRNDLQAPSPSLKFSSAFPLPRLPWKLLLNQNSSLHLPCWAPSWTSVPVALGSQERCATPFPGVTALDVMVKQTHASGWSGSEAARPVSCSTLSWDRSRCTTRCPCPWPACQGASN